MSKEECKILFLVSDLGNGGQEKQLYYLNKSLQSSHIKTTVAVWDFNTKDKYYSLLNNLSIEVLDLGQQSTYWKKILFLRNFIKKKNVKIFHSFSFHLNFVLWLCCLGTACKPLGGIRSNLRDNFNNSNKLKFILNCFAPKNQISNNLRFYTKFKLAWLHRLFNKVYIVENALDIDKYNYLIPDVKTIFKTISVGNLYSVKRIDILIKAVTLLKSKGIIFKHYHAGTGILEHELKSFAEKMNITDCFIFLGNVENVPAFLSDADLFFHTSEFEGCPNAVMEAMASGIAVVSTNCGDVPYLIEDGVNGFVVPVNDVEKLAEKALYLLNHPVKCREMGIAGRKKAEALFSLDVYRKKTLMVYHQLNKDICVE